MCGLGPVLQVAEAPTMEDFKALKELVGEKLRGVDDMRRRNFANLERHLQGFQKCLTNLEVRMDDRIRIIEDAIEELFQHQKECAGRSSEVHQHTGKYVEARQFGVILSNVEALKSSKADSSLVAVEIGALMQEIRDTKTHSNKEMQSCRGEMQRLRAAFTLDRARSENHLRDAEEMIRGLRQKLEHMPNTRQQIGVADDPRLLSLVEIVDRYPNWFGQMINGIEQQNLRIDAMERVMQGCQREADAADTNRDRFGDTLSSKLVSFHNDIQQRQWQQEFEQRAITSNAKTDDNQIASAEDHIKWKQEFEQHRAAEEVRTKELKVHLGELESEIAQQNIVIEMILRNKCDQAQCSAFEHQKIIVDQNRKIESIHEEISRQQEISSERHILENQRYQAFTEDVKKLEAGVRESRQANDQRLTQLSRDRDWLKQELTNTKTANDEKHAALVAECQKVLIQLVKYRIAETIRRKALLEAYKQPKASIADQSREAESGNDNACKSGGFALDSTSHKKTTYVKSQDSNHEPAVSQPSDSPSKLHFIDAASGYGAQHPFGPA